MDELKKRLTDYGIEWVNETEDTVFLQSVSESVDSELLSEIEFSYGKAVKIEKIDFQLNTKSIKNKVPFISNLEEVFRSGMKFGASDIHIERYQKRCSIRMRIDGMLMPFYEIQPVVYQSIINKIKIQSGLDISEKRMPHDGRINFTQDGVDVELRVSIIPTIYGEKAVLRYLRNDLSHLSIENLGLNTEQYNFLKSNLKKKSGLILLSGPTGSGKTTTLYTFLKHLNDASVNILTIEDPIEYSLYGINQVQLKEDIGLTYPHALRSFLRQDPDIIMVGEIRDVETAQMAIRSSLTGHLVLSTIHANTTIGIVNRLVDMGIPFYQIKTALRMAVSQRLVRLYCETCLGKGCSSCLGSGFRGRQALFEFMDAEKLNGFRQSDDILKKDISYVGGSMQEQVNTYLSKNITAKEELMPIYNEFES